VSAADFRRQHGRAVCMTASTFFAAFPWAGAWMVKDWVGEIALCLQMGTKARSMRGGDS